MFGKKRGKENLKKSKISIDEDALKNSKEALKNSKEVLKVLKASLQEVKETLKSKEMLCACLLYRFIEDNDIDAYQSFVNRMATFNVEEKRLVFAYYTNFPKKNTQIKNKMI